MSPRSASDSLVAHQLGGLAWQPPDLDQLEAERLDPVDQAVQLRLVADGPMKDGLDRLEIARIPSKLSRSAALTRPRMRIS